MMRTTASGTRSGQAGFTLIELMVSLLIGFAVIGALLTAYMTSVRSSGHNDAMVQITEDATQALNVMRSQVAMAGYSDVHGSSPTGGLNLEIIPAVFGCHQGAFSDLTADILTNMANATAVAGGGCTANSPAGGPDSLEVAYEAVAGTNATSPSNAILDGKGVPLDCLGNSLAPPHAATGAGLPAFYLNDSKFYVANGALNCHAAGKTAGAPLVDNVESLSVTYGLGQNKVRGTANQIVAYTNAPAASDWPNVLSATICVQVRSATKVLDKQAAPTLGVYVDCNNEKTTNADGYLRRTFTTTVLLQN